MFWVMIIHTRNSWPSNLRAAVPRIQLKISNRILFIRWLRIFSARSLRQLAVNSKRVWLMRLSSDFHFVKNTIPNYWWKEMEISRNMLILAHTFYWLNKKVGNTDNKFNLFSNIKSNFALSSYFVRFGAIYLGKKCESGVNWII